jgi:transcription antitermination protein NusB
MTGPQTKVSPRREGREAAAQMLYAFEMNPGDRLEFIEFWSLHSASALARKFAEELFLGVVPHLADIDAKLVAVIENWDLKRLEAVDRAVLRLAVYEMWWCLDTPPLVAMNEAIESSKRLGTPDSAGFVNGILDRLASTLDRPLRTAVKKVATRSPRPPEPSKE